MSDTTELNKEEDIDTTLDAYPTVGGPGELLSETRIAQGLSLDVVAESLKMSVAYVEALESGDYSLLPGPAFVRGYLRSYARLLALDEEHILSLCEETVSVDKQVVTRILKETPLDYPGSHYSRSLIALFCVIVLASILGSIVWWNNGRNDAIETTIPSVEQPAIDLVDTITKELTTEHTSDAAEATAESSE